VVTPHEGALDLEAERVQAVATTHRPCEHIVVGLEEPVIHRGHLSHVVVRASSRAGNMSWESELCPRAPLLRPALVPNDHSQGVLGHRRLDAVDALEVKDLLLDVGGQQQQVEELRDARAGEAELACHVGPVAVVAAVDRRLEAWASARALATRAGRCVGAGGGDGGSSVLSPSAERPLTRIR